MKVESRLPAVVCALMLPLCALAIWPVAEMGLMDDWSYTKTAQVLAQTGHIVYNGWATAMLGWQIHLGALFIKLFGFSFTAVRLSMLPVAMATAFLIHRIFIRCGINQWNATLGTLTLVLSPLFLPLALSFMSDVPGLFCIVLCLYACLRALQANTDRSAIAWLCFAAVSNAIGGTVRQIAWLGVLVMVPSTLWLLRRRPRFLFAGSILYVICVAFIFFAHRWFHHQPYSVPEDLIQGRITIAILANLVSNMGRLVLEMPLLLLPILLFFIPAVPFSNRRALRIIAIGGSLCIAFRLVQALRHKLLLAPYMIDYITIHGIMDDVSLHSEGPIILNSGIRILLTVLAEVSLVCLFAVLLTRKKTPPQSSALSQQISWHQLIVLLGPFTLCYLGLLLPRAFFDVIWDRYTLSLMLVASIFVLRFYQENIRPRLPAAALVPIAIFAAFGIAGTHDTFALVRARLAVIDELRAAGVPATAIDGGLEYNGWNQIELARYIDDPRIPVLPGDSFRPFVSESFGVCTPLHIDSFSAVSPRYGMAYDPAACLGQAAFTQVTFRTWLGPRSNTLYIVNIGLPQRK